MHSVLQRWAVRLQGTTFSSFAVRMFEALFGLPFSFSLLASSLPICSSTTKSDIAALWYCSQYKDKPCLRLPVAGIQLASLRICPILAISSMT